MTPFQKKLHDCLISIGHQAEKIPAPTKEEMKKQFEEFMQAVENDDMKAMRKTSEKLGGVLVRWMVERL